MNIFLKLIKSSLANCLQIKMENIELYLNTSGLHRFFQVEKKTPVSYSFDSYGIIEQRVYGA